MRDAHFTTRGISSDVSVCLSLPDAFLEHVLFGAFSECDQDEKFYSVVFEGPESIAHIGFYVRTLIVRVIRVRKPKSHCSSAKLQYFLLKFVSKYS